jgi:hypothetical protein
VKTGTESDRALVGVNLAVTEGLVVVSGNDHVDGLNDTGEVLVQILLGDLKFEERTIDLVDDDNRLDTLTKSLAEHGLGLDADTFNGIDDDESTVGNTESSSDLRGEVNVTGGVDQVDQEVILLDLNGNVLKILGILELGVQRDGSGLDCHTTLLLVRTRIRESSFSGLCCRDNTGTLDERVGKGRFSVIDYRGSSQLSAPNQAVRGSNPTGFTYREQ